MDGAGGDNGDIGKLYGEGDLTTPVLIYISSLFRSA